MAGNVIENSQLTTGNVGDNSNVGYIINVGECHRTNEGDFSCGAFLETRINNCEQVFVETDAFRGLTKKLKEKHSVVLTGPPGEGKTTMGTMTCKQLMDEGYVPLFYDTLDSVPLEPIAKTKKNVFVVVDDFLGKSHFDPKQMEEKQRCLSALRDIQQTKQREKKQMTEGQMTQQKSEQKFPMLLLLLSRDNVYQQANRLMSDEDRYFCRHTISSSTSLLPHERAKLLENYCTKAQKAIDEQQAEAILKLDCPFAFPKMCHLYSVMTSKDLDPIQFFQSPQAALKDEVFGMMNNDPLVKATLTLLHLEEILVTNDLEDPQSDGYRRLTEKLQMIKEELPLPAQVEDVPFPLTDVLESMCGGLLEKRCGLVAFSHDGVRDAVALALAKDHVAFVAKHCSLDFINKHIHLSYDTGSKSITVQLRKDQSIFFVRRLVTEVEQRNLKGAFTCPLIQNSKFLASFIANLKRSEKIHELVHVKDKPLGLCFLFWLSISSSSQLQDFISEYTFSDEEMWQAFCGSCVMGQADQIEFLYKKLALPPEWTEPLHCLCSETSEVSSAYRILPLNSGSVAAAHGHIRVSDILLRLGTPVDVMDLENKTLLLHASNARKKVEVATLLTEYNADWKISVCEYCNGLNFANQSGNWNRATYRLRAEKFCTVPLDTPITRQGPTLLMLACGKNPQLARNLLALKAKTDLKDFQGRSCLHYACCSDDPELIRELVQTHDTNVNEADKRGATPLHQACLKPGNRHVVKALLDAGADPHKKALGATPLHVACTSDLESAKLLLERMSKIDETDALDWTPLSYACMSGKADIVNYLLDMNARVELDDRDKNTVLHLASRAGSTSVVSCLVERKPSLLNALNRASHTPLFVACVYGHDSVAQDLILKKAEVDKRDQHGRNPLHAVASTGRMTTLKILFKTTLLDVNSRDNMNATPLMLACFYDEVCVVSCLVENRADVESRDTNGNTALHYAAASGKGCALTYSGAEHQDDSVPEGTKTERGRVPHDIDLMLPNRKKLRTDLNVECEEKGGIIGILLKKNLQDIDVRNEDENTPMLIACLSGEVKKVDHLIEKGANTHARDRLGNTALHHASGEGHLPVLELLKAKTNVSITEENYAGDSPLDVALKKKRFHVIDFIAEHVRDYRDVDGNTPLHTAAKSGNIPAAKILLDVVKIPVDARNNAKQTPLHCASEVGDEKIVGFFVQRGASTNATDIKGYFPLHYALFRDHLATGKILFEKNPSVIDSVGADGLIPLCHACEKRNVDVQSSDLAKYLIREDGNAAHRQNGDTSLHVAARRGYLETVKVLVEKVRIPVDIPNHGGETPLHCACAAVHEPVAAYLCKKGASTSVLYRGETALHIAARCGGFPLMQDLVEMGNASVTARNARYERPAGIAFRSGAYLASLYLWLKE